jgi:hypothetical protein
MSDFDPYHKWLGIPASQQPPNHYRLLALDLFESDLEVIEAAVDRIVSFLQDVAAGPQAKDSQMLLNEIAEARLCLLDRVRKSAYDERLRAESDHEVPQPEVDIQPAPPPIASANERPAVRVSPIQVNALSASNSKRCGRRRNLPLLLWSIVAAGGLLIGAVVLLLLAGVSSSQARRRTAEDARVHEQQGSTTNASKTDR